MFLINFWLVLMFLVAFLSLKKVKNEGVLCATLGNELPSQSRDARKRIRERNPSWSNFAWWYEIQRTAVPRKIWNTSLSPFFTYYTSFRISGSQESNASNGLQFGVETRKWWPIEGNWAKLKRNFTLTFPNAKIFALTFPDAKIFTLTFPNAKIFTAHFSNAKIFTLTFSDAKFFAPPFSNAKM